MKSKKSILCLIPVSMLVLSIIVAACGQQAVAASFEEVKADWEKVVAAANKEGELTVYGRFPDAVLDIMKKVWKERYPDIKLNILGLGGTEFLERIKAEQASKNVEADLVLGPDSNMWTFQDLEILADTYPGKVLPNLNDPAIPWKDKPRVDNTTMYGFMITVFSAAINTELVPPEREPKSWWDLVDPWFEGKVVLLNPGAGTGGRWYMLLRQALGADFHKQLAANKAIITAMGSEEIPAAVAAGEYAVQAPAKVEIYLKMPKEAPTKLIFPKEGIRASISCASIPKNVRHPNAALVFENLLLSKELQGGMGLLGRPPARLDCSTPFPILKKANDVPWLYDTKDFFLKNQKSIMKEARQIYSLQ